MTQTKSKTSAEEIAILKDRIGGRDNVSYESGSQSSAEEIATLKDRVSDLEDRPTFSIVVKDGAPTLFVAANVFGKLKVLQTRMSDTVPIVVQVDALVAELHR